MPGGIPTATRPSRTPRLPRNTTPQLHRNTTSNCTDRTSLSLSSHPEAIISPTFKISNSHHFSLHPLLQPPSDLLQLLTWSIKNPSFPFLAIPYVTPGLKILPAPPHHPSLQGPMGPGPQLLLPSSPLLLPPALMLLRPQRPLCHALATSAVLPSRAPDTGSPAQGTSSVLSTCTASWKRPHPRLVPPPGSTKVTTKGPTLEDRKEKPRWLPTVPAVSKHLRQGRRQVEEGQRNSEGDSVETHPCHS